MDNKVRLLPYKINQDRGDLMAVPYGEKMIKADNLWDKAQKGEGIVIAIIDTGCDINHEALQGKIIHTRNFTNDDGGNKDIVTDYLTNNAYNYTDLKNQIIFELLPYINELTGRRPIILPVIMEVNQSIY